MVIEKKFEFEFDYSYFCEYCITHYENFKISDLLNDTLVEKYFKEYCRDRDWCDDYETVTFIENDKEIILEIQSITKEKCNSVKVENKTSMEEEIQNQIKSNYNFEVKIENQIASACIAKINQISWQKAINALKN